MNKRPSFWLRIGVGLVLVAIVAIWFLAQHRGAQKNDAQAGEHAAKQQVQKVTKDKAQTENAATSLANQVLIACANPKARKQLLRISPHACEQAAHTKTVIGRPGTPGGQGPTGATGPGPTDDQVRVVLEQMCGTCRGGPGPVGPISTVPGPQGPGPTNDQVASVLASMCGSCQGPKGDPGGQGPKGDTGGQGQPGSVTPGTYTCPSGQYVEGVVVGADGGFTLDCQPLPGLIPPAS